MGGCSWCVCSLLLFVAWMDGRDWWGAVEIWDESSSCGELRLANGLVGWMIHHHHDSRLPQYNFIPFFPALDLRVWSKVKHVVCYYIIVVSSFVPLSLQIGIIRWDRSAIQQQDRQKQNLLLLRSIKVQELHEEDRKQVRQCESLKLNRRWEYSLDCRTE